jgi:hypothetical protein
VELGMPLEEVFNDIAVIDNTGMTFTVALPPE